MPEKDYAAIAAKHITRPANIVRMPKFLIYSRNKKGKTTFGLSSGIDITLTIDPENGTDEMKTKNPHRWAIERWEELDDLYNYLRYSKHPYKWVIVDGLTKISNMSLKYVMKIQEERTLDRIPGMVQQRDYGKAGELMKDMLGKFHALPMGVVFTAQERQQDGGDSEDDDDVEDIPSIYVPDLPKGVRSAVNSLVDVIGRLYVVQVLQDDGTRKAQRRLWIGESLKYDTGYRSDFVLPDYLVNPTVPRLVRLIRTGKAAAPVAAKTTATAVKPK